MATTSAWVAELTERRQRAEARKKNAQHELETAEQELVAVDAALSGLQPLANLDQGIAPPPTVVSPAKLATIDGEQLPLWKWAFAALEAADRPLRIPEIIAEIDRIGGPPMKTPERRESLRTIIRGKDHFEALGDGGYYGLASWPEAKKRIRAS